MTRLVAFGYRVIHRLLPCSFRKRYGDEMDEYLRKRSLEIVRKKGRLALVGFAMRTYGDVLKTAFAEWRDNRSSADSESSSDRNRTDSLMTSLFQDFKFAVRTMVRSPGFSIVTVVVLALGIGVNVAMFSTAFSVFVKPLPYPNPERLVLGQADGGWFLSAPDCLDLKERSDVYESFGAIMPFEMDHTVTGGPEPERLPGAVVSPDLFSTLGVLPLLGRSFHHSDGLVDAPEVVIISHGYWQRRFGGSTSAVGSTLTINGTPFFVIGVMPDGFGFLPKVEFWRVMRPDRDSADRRDRDNWYVVGRLKPEVSVEQAQAQANLIFSQLAALYPETNQDDTIILAELRSVLVADYRLRMTVLAAAIGVVLLLAITNITGMLLARAPSRRVELTTKAALGASVWRLVRQMLAETLLLATIGGMLGVVVAMWIQRVILTLLRLDIPGVGDLNLNLSLFVFALGLSLLVGVVAGIYPALSCTRRNLIQDLKSGSRTTIGSGTGFRNGLTVAQVAMSVMLLIGSTLLVRSFLNERSMDPGFQANRLLTAEIGLSGSRYSESSARIQFYTSLLDELKASPGIVSAGLINNLPIRSPRNFFHAYAQGHPEDDHTIFLRAVLPGYFESMGIRMLSGRDVLDSDAAETNQVYVINNAASKAFFGDEIPLGQTLVVDFFDDPAPAEIVGIVDDVLMDGLNADPRPTVYAPFTQLTYSRMQVAIRYSGEQNLAVSALKSSVITLDRDVPIAGIIPMDNLIAESMSGRKTIAFSLSLYAALPLLLAAVGLYAVLAYHVSQRSNEIGVRMALGADAKKVALTILKRGIVLISIGVTIGVLGAWGLTRLIRQMLFGIAPLDPLTFVGVTAFVVGIALFACIAPSWRAARVDPIKALQAE